MTSDEYAEIAHAAKVFQLDQQLSPHRRRIAQSLYELAKQLTDPNYGCPAETHAVMAMYRHMLNTAQQAEADFASASTDKADFAGAGMRGRQPVTRRSLAPTDQPVQ